METLHTHILKRLSEKPRRKPIRKVLLIDSEANSVLPTALARERCHVVHCNCVQKAWQFVYPQRPDLIVFCLHKSDESALSDLHECRALAGSVPIIVSSSVHISPDFLKALPRGRAAVVADGVTAEIAAETLRSLKSRRTEH